MRDPQVFVSPAAYRPIRVYVGEVTRPGYYNLVGQQEVLGVAAGISKIYLDRTTQPVKILCALVGLINPAIKLHKVVAWQLMEPAPTHGF